MCKKLFLAVLLTNLLTINGLATQYPPTSSQKPPQKSSEASKSQDPSLDPEDIFSNTTRLTKGECLQAGQKLIAKVGKWRSLGKLTGKGNKQELVVLELLQRINKENSSYNIALKMTGKKLPSSRPVTLVYLFSHETLEKNLQVLDGFKVDGTGKDNLIPRPDNNGIGFCPSYKNTPNGKPIGISISVEMYGYIGEDTKIKNGFAKVAFGVDKLSCNFALNELPAIRKFFASGLK